METVRRSGVRAIALGIAVLLGPIVAGGAPPTPYDFSGQWSGSAEQQASSVGLTATFASTAGTRAFTGTMTVAGNPPSTCQVKGKEKHNGKVKIRLTCDDGGLVHIHGMLDTTTNSVAGTFKRTKHGKPRQTGTFTLTKQGP